MNGSKPGRLRLLRQQRCRSVCPWIILKWTIIRQSAGDPPLPIVALKAHALGNRKLEMTHRSISSLDFGTVAVWGEGLAKQFVAWVRPCSQRSRLRPKPAAAPAPVPRGRLRHQRQHASPRDRAVTEQKWPALWVRWVLVGAQVPVCRSCHGRFTTILQWQRKKDCYFKPLFILARGLSLIALALTLVALTPAKSVALIAAISVIPLIYASSSLLLSRSPLSRCLLGCKLLRGNVIGGRDGTCGLPSLCRHSLGCQRGAAALASSLRARLILRRLYAVGSRNHGAREHIHHRAACFGG